MALFPRGPLDSVSTAFHPLWFDRDVGQSSGGVPSPAHSSVRRARIDGRQGAHGGELFGVVDGVARHHCRLVAGAGAAEHAGQVVGGGVGAVTHPDRDVQMSQVSRAGGSSRVEGPHVLKGSVLTQEPLDSASTAFFPS
jgi:hypothetical protein